MPVRCCTRKTPLQTSGLRCWRTTCCTATTTKLPWPTSLIFAHGTMYPTWQAKRTQPPSHSNRAISIHFAAVAMTATLVWEQQLQRHWTLREHQANRSWLEQAWRQALDGLSIQEPHHGDLPTFRPEKLHGLGDAHARALPASGLAGPGDGGAGLGKHMPHDSICTQARPGRGPVHALWPSCRCTHGRRCNELPVVHCTHRGQLWSGHVLLALVTGLAAHALDRVQARPYGYNGWSRPKCTIWRQDVLGQAAAEAERWISLDLKRNKQETVVVVHWPSMLSSASSASWWPPAHHMPGLNTSVVMASAASRKGYSAQPPLCSRALHWGLGAPSWWHTQRKDHEAGPQEPHHALGRRSNASSGRWVH